MKNLYISAYGIVLLNVLLVNCQEPLKEIFCLEGDRGINFNQRLIDDHNKMLTSVGARSLESDPYLMQDAMKYSKKLVESMSYPDRLDNSEGTGYFYEEFLYSNFQPAPPLNEAILDPVTKWWNSNKNDLQTEILLGSFGIDALKKGDYKKAGCGLCATFYGHYVTCRYTPIGIVTPPDPSSTTVFPTNPTWNPNPTLNTTWNPNPTSNPTWNPNPTSNPTSNPNPTPNPTVNPNPSPWNNIMLTILIVSATTVLGFCILAIGMLVMFIYNQYKSRILGDAS
ncbi:uncharacterized protein LOC135842947 isoform X1 [Planococcus citri]|uniref:uncharacterized protein LOC135842947 isoform X1 n=1 Tax=Planococcus citri TaxID=170843 RepID=UPI0031F80B2D